MKPPTIFDHEKRKAYRAALDLRASTSDLLGSDSSRIAARDHLDRASTRGVLNPAEGNGKRAHAERGRFFDTARGSAVACAASWDIPRVNKQIFEAQVDARKPIGVEGVSLAAGSAARYPQGMRDEGGDYGLPTEENE